MLNVTSMQIGEEVEDSERQNNALILVTLIPRTK